MYIYYIINVTYLCMYIYYIILSMLTHLDSFRRVSLTTKGGEWGETENDGI